MLRPQLFDINEAWLAFRLNRDPVRTDEDGDFDCIALMDAASCYILSMELYPVTDQEPGKRECRRLLEAGRNHKNELPKLLFIPVDAAADILVREAERLKVDVVRVDESDLLIFIQEARQAFSERFE